MIALTFDDGPDPEWTPLVLKALDTAGVLATFFVVAEQIEAQGGAELLSELLRRGHSVQLHCARHVRHEQLSLDQLRADTEQAERVLALHGVGDPALWRPPYGSVHPQHSCRVAAERGRQLVRWTYDTVDYRGLPASAMLAAARDGELRGNSVVLMHDSRRYSSTPRGGARGTVELIGPLVEFARAQGWTLGPLEHPLCGEADRGEPDRSQMAFLLPCGL